MDYLLFEFALIYNIITTKEEKIYRTKRIKHSFVLKNIFKNYIFVSKKSYIVLRKG